MADSSITLQNEASDESLLARLTGYWRRVQVAAALESLKDERDGSGAEDSEENVIRAAFTYDGFLRGSCPQSVHVRAFARVDRERLQKHKKAVEYNPNAVMPAPAEHIGVVFSPFALRMPGEAHPIGVLFGTASVDRNGTMTTAEPDSDLPPVWVGRTSLAPSDGIENKLFPLADADRYYDEMAAEKHEIETWPSEWTAVLRACDRIWQRTNSAASPLMQALLRAFHVEDGWLRFEAKDPKKLTIVRMYEKLLEKIADGTAEPLYRELALGNHRRIFANSMSEKHLGQMSADFPLAPSQRSSLLAYLDASKGNIVAVNGPPGTGKTTLLQSVVATEFVSRALAKSQAPLYIAGAATNQAVSNIIKAFREATENLDHPMAERWMPGLRRRYGTYFRGGKGEGLTLAKGSLVCVPLNFGLHNNYDDDGILKILSQIELYNKEGLEVPIDLFFAIGESTIVHNYFLEAASHEFNNFFPDLESVADEIHARLKNIHAKIVIYCNSADCLMSILKRLSIDIDTHKTYDNALSVLQERSLAARDELEILEHRHREEHCADNFSEQIAMDNEDGKLAELDRIIKLEDETIRFRDDANLKVIADTIASLLLIKKHFESYREPTTFMIWFSEKFFPWVRNRQTLGLKNLLEVIEQSGLDSYDDSDTRSTSSMRAKIGQTIDKIKQFAGESQSIKDKRNAKIKANKARRERYLFAILESRYDRSETRKANMSARANEKLERELYLKPILESPAELRGAYNAVRIQCRDVFDEEPPQHLADISGKIDTNLRVEAFLLATHYWECNFLMNVKRSGWRDQRNRRAAFRLMAMLTPCFVSTFDKMGSAFNIMKQGVVYPMWGLADTLIIDEAGQASPDKGAFAFSLAKKALVVGDNLQLPPVNTADAGSILASIAKSTGLLSNSFVTTRGALTGKVGTQNSSGSLMRMASAAAAYDSSATAEGMWLRDHFRCDPRIIAYCNKIWYTGETSLVPRRVRDKESFVPHFGHMNVIGKTANKSNVAEAMAIMEWLNINGEALQAHYDAPLHEIVAVLTPFSNQRKLLREVRDRRFRWANAYQKPGDIVMGTVHALQGAERSIVLFSTVYDRPESSYFFDFEHTMLNVAVSRAKDSFIVFGNEIIFDDVTPTYSKPSTFLREHLFEEAPFEVPAFKQQDFGIN